MCPCEMVGRCPFEWRPFSIELSCSTQATFLLNPGNWPAGEGKLNACRWKGSEAWILPSHCIHSFFLLSRPVQYSNSLLYSYFCFFIAFKILFAFSYFCFFIALKILSFLISAFSISIFFRSLSYKFLLASLHRIFPLYPSSVFPVLYPTSYIIEQRHLIYSRSEIWGL